MITILSIRLKESRIKNKLTQERVAKEFNVQRQIISYFETGKRLPSILDIIKFAKLYNTSADYLLGLTAVKSTNKDINFICDYTGLNEEAVESIRKLVSVAKDKEDVIRHLLTQTKFMIRVLE